VEIKIGVQHTNRELVLESTASAEEVLSLVNAAVKDGTLLTLTDEKGRQIIVPGAQVAFVELGAPEGRKVGFAT